VAHHTSRTPAPHSSVPRTTRLLTGLLAVGITVGPYLVVAGPARAATPPPTGPKPVAVISVPDRVYVGIPVTLSGARSSSASGAISEWDWDLGGDGRYETTSLSDPNVTKAFPRGRHTVGLRVRGQNGLVASTTTTFTAVKPPSAAAEPAAPAAVAAEAKGTEVTLTWTAPLGAAPLAYRLTAKAADNADPAPVHVPGRGETTFTFTDLVPDSYTFDVAALNAAGRGPAASAEATVRSKGATAAPSSSATAVPGSEPTASGAGDPNTGASATAATTGGTSAGPDDESNRDLLGLGLIAGGVLLLVGALATVVVGARRRDGTA
jgi:PKD repeat protein